MPDSASSKRSRIVIRERDMFDPGTETMVTVPVYRRERLEPGAELAGPAAITEDETTTVVQSGFTARINALGYIVMHREKP